jgi:hypothetical protein
MLYNTGSFKIPFGRLGYCRIRPDDPLWETMFWVATDNPVSGLKPIQDTPKLPDTTGFSEEQIYDLYAKYVELHGNADARQALADGKQVIVALRLETDVRANKGQGVYDDRMAIIWKDTETDTKHGKDFAANTEPSAQYEQREKEKVVKTVKKDGKYVKVTVNRTVDLYDPDGNKVIFSKNDGQDVDQNKRRDMGRLAAGTYSFKNTGGKFLDAAYLHAQDGQVAQRDVNHDGRFNSADTWTGKDNASTSTHSGNFGMHIHRGGKNNTWSAGCQTLPPAEHTKFFQTLKKQDVYYYVLVNVE